MPTRRSASLAPLLRSAIGLSSVLSSFLWSPFSCRFLVVTAYLLHLVLPFICVKVIFSFRVCPPLCVVLLVVVLFTSIGLHG